MTLRPDHDQPDDPTTPARRDRRRRRPGRRGILGAALALTVALGTGGLLVANAHTNVVLDVDGELTEVGTFAGSVETLLEEQRIEYGEHDLVAPSPQSELSDGATVVVRSAIEIQVEIDGEPVSAWTTAETTGEALATIGGTGRDVTVTASRSLDGPRQPLDLPLVANSAVHLVIDGEREVVEITGEADLAGVLDHARVRLGKHDEVTVGVTGNGLAEIRITRVSLALETERDTVEHETVEREDDTLYAGERRVVQEGVDGERIRAIAVANSGGDAQRGDPSDYVVTTEPVTEIIAVGTRPRPAPAPPATGSGGSSDSSDSGDSGGSSDSGGSGDSSEDSSGGSAVSGDVWAQLAQCESGGNPSAVSPNGLYHGLYQFSVPTWQSVGGSGLPSQASADEQLQRAQTLQARAGWGQWPACARSLGLL